MLATITGPVSRQGVTCRSSYGLATTRVFESAREAGAGNSRVSFLLLSAAFSTLPRRNRTSAASSSLGPARHEGGSASVEKTD